MSPKRKTVTVREAALYLKGTDTKLPLKEVRVDVTVKDVASHTTVTQVFENRERTAIEAVYCFPVEEGAAVNGFDIETGGRSIKGVVEEREKAFETYDRAIEAGDAAYLLDRETDDILYISVGNVAPGQEVRARVAYVAELPVTDGVVRLQIPTTVSPRYAPQNSDPVKVDRTTPPCDPDVPYRLGLTVKVLSSFVAGLSSPSHTIRMTREGEYTVVTLAEETVRLDRDFILEISTERRREPICILASNGGGEKAALLRLFPEFDDIAPDKESNSEVLFVLDCSGSMQGSSIEEAKSALELSLRSLSENDLFNIVRFGSTCQFYRDGPVPYNSVTLNEALNYVRGIEADLGGTELAPAMKRLCSMPKREGFTRDVLLITDGEVVNPDSIIDMIARARDRMRVFTFGIGYGASHALVKGAARAGRGAWEMIQPGEKVQPKVLRQFSRMCQPALDDVSVAFTGMKAELPRILPPLFEGDSCTIFARVLETGPDAEVTFTGSCLGKTLTWNARVGEEMRDDAVPCLWALSRIRELQDQGPSAGGSNQFQRRAARIEKEVTDIGLRFGLLTPYTSFMAVEERKGDEKIHGRPEFRRVPVQMTKDWHGTTRNVSYMTYMIGGQESKWANKGKRLFFKTIPREAVKLMMGGDRPELACSTIGSNKPRRLEKVPWCLELLGTQEAEGFFTGANIVAKRLKLSPRDLEKLVDALDIAEETDRRNILVTLLAVHLLSSDPDAKAVAGRAIGKAERWLRKQVSEHVAGGHVVRNADIGSMLTVKGEPLRKHLKERYNIVV